MKPHQIGMGYNPRFVDGTLTLPPSASYVEAGAQAFFDDAHGMRDRLPGIDRFSLHLARAPFCEPVDVQRLYVTQLAGRIPSYVSTIGLHLSGAMQSDLGYFGLGTAFRPTEVNEASAHRFLSLLREATGRHLLLENANYYDEHPRDAIRVLKAHERLCRSLGVGLILDLAHLVMNANNTGIDCRHLLGVVSLEHVEVIHLSGIVEAPGGVFHDGHQLPVHPRVWELLDEVLALLDRPVTVVVEHSDPRWNDDDPRFAADHARLRQILGQVRQNRPDHEIDLDKVAIGYMANLILPQHCQELHEALGATLFGKLARLWGADYLLRAKKTKGTVVLRAEERSLFDGPLVDPTADFEAYVRDLRERTNAERTLADAQPR